MGQILEGTATILTGAGAKEEGKFLAAQHKKNAQLGKIKADQTAAYRRDQLQKQIGTIRAVRATRGVKANSATGDAIRRDLKDAAHRNLTNEMFNIAQNIEQEQLAARFAKARGNAAFAASLIAGTGQIATGVQSAFAPKKKEGE